MKKPVKKSGFAEGRAATGGPTRSSSGKKKKRPEESERIQRKIAKIEKAKSDLADVIESMGDISVEGNEAHTMDEEGNIISKFAKDYAKLRKDVLGSGTEFNADAAQRMLYKTMFSMTMDLIPFSEVTYRKSGKEQAGYVMIGLIKQAEELAASLKMLGNVENQSEFIRNSIIQPLFFSMLQMFFQQFMGYKNIIDSVLPNKPKTAKKLKLELDKILTTTGTFMDSSRESMSTNIGSYLAGDLTFSTDNQETGVGKRRKRSKS